MSKILDLSNQTFGYLKVKELHHIKYTHSFWTCLCIHCGKDTIVRGTDLYNGKSTKCKRCVNRVFNKEQSLEIAKRFVNGESKISIQRDLNCSFTAIYSALNLVKSLDKVQKLTTDIIDASDIINSNNNHLLNHQQSYVVWIGFIDEPWITIDNKKYHLDIDYVKLKIDLDGDIVRVIIIDGGYMAMTVLGEITNITVGDIIIT